MKSIVVILAACLLTLAVEAEAQPCADPRAQPAVCTVETYAGLTGERVRAFDLDGSAQVELRQQLAIEIDAFDQNRRRFPKDRLRFDYDANECRDLLKVERTDVGRFALHVGDARGECTLWFWLPGNLNYQWSLDLQIAPRARSGYEYSEAQVITERLYQALLGRQPDPQGRRDTSAAIARGELDRRLDEILRSDEFRRRAQGAHPGWMLEQLYLGLLGRKPDDSAIQAFTSWIQRGQIGDVTRELLRSDEFESQLRDR